MMTAPEALNSAVCLDASKHSSRKYLTERGSMQGRLMPGVDPRSVVWSALLNIYFNAETLPVRINCRYFA